MGSSQLGMYVCANLHFKVRDPEAFVECASMSREGFDLGKKNSNQSDEITMVTDRMILDPLIRSYDRIFLCQVT